MKTQVLKNRNEAIPSKLDGNTVIAATLGPDGLLQKVDVYQPSGSELLDLAAKSLAERSAPFPYAYWQFDSLFSLLLPLAYRFE